MKIFYSDTFELPLPEKHRFPMAKYRLLRERVAESPEFAAADLEIPVGATDQELALIHDPAYIQSVIAGTLTDLEVRRIGFPWSTGLMERSRRSVGASIEAARHALTEGVSVNLAGGTHHAFPDSGQGYCVFNDVAVAAAIMRLEQRVTRVLFIDLDVHQGNGTAFVTKPDPDLFSFSMHCEKNYPFRKMESDLDISLPPGTGDPRYLRELSQALTEIGDRFAPELVFYLAGADPYSGDRLGLLGLSKSGLGQRDEMVFDFCERHRLPIAVSMSGGYAPNLEDIVDIHFATVSRALQHHEQCHQYFMA